MQAGQVLFTIDSRSAKADVLNAQAAVASAKSELIRLQRDEQRYSTLYSQSAVSKQTYDQAVAQAEQAQAAVDAKQALFGQQLGRFPRVMRRMRTLQRAGRQLVSGKARNTVCKFVKVKCK